MWEQIQANRRRSIILIIGMAIFLVVFGFIAGHGFLGKEGGFLGIIVAFGVWAVQMGIYAASPQSILLSNAGARELGREENPQLFNIVEEMCIASGLSTPPKIYLIDDPAPNAFAMGGRANNNIVTVTTGLLYRLNRDELQGVIAHEIAHLKNRDSQFLTLAAVFLGTVVILSDLIWRSMRSTGRRRSSSRGGGQAQVIFFVIAILFAIFGPILLRLLYLACSRKREFLADACAVQFTRYPEGLASALEKISGFHAEPAFNTKVIAPMFIINPLHGNEGSSLWSTHPSTEDRIRILRSMGGASLSDYQNAYCKAEGKNLIGSSAMAESSTETIRSPSSSGPIQTRHETSALIQQLDGFVPVQCSCGILLSAPQSFAGQKIDCLRCGTSLDVPNT
jgi:heat shock protein HtpX